MEVSSGKHTVLQFFNQKMKVILAGVIVLSFLFALNQLRRAQFFPIKTVHVYGVNRVDHEEVRSLLTPLVSQGFFNVNMDFIRDRLKQMPWVSDIFVRRNWPDQVEITILEKVPVALWNDESLLSKNGELFNPKSNTYPPNLPHLMGPNGKQIIMLQYFDEINRLLVPLHAKIASLELSPFYTWKMKLDNGVILQMGHKDILTRLYHFVKVYPKMIGNRAREVEYIDLRYPNGMAVRWKAPIKT